MANHPVPKSKAKATASSDPKVMETFENVYLDLSKQPGRCRFAESGLGWRPKDGDTYTLEKGDIASAQWSRAARGHEVKVLTRNGRVVQLDGFKQDDFEPVSKVFKNWWAVPFEQRDHNIRGWNWGKADFGKAELAFNVQSRPAFEVPYSEISNTNLAGKNEVVVELSLPANGEETGTSGKLGGARGQGKKAGGACDQLVEMRFYIPGTASRKEKSKGKAKNGDGDEGDDASDDDDDEQQNAAQLFYETLNEKADLGEVSGDTYATFPEVLHLTPRGRFDIDMYEGSLRLRGKTYDYKIQYDSIKKFMMLPKPDDVHNLITLGLEPPLRQGQTRYPFLVMQFKRDEDLQIELNITEEDLEKKYGGKLEPSYRGEAYIVFGQILRVLSGKRVTKPSADFLSHHQQSGVKCSVKANEGHLFCLEKSFMFVPKPATYIAFDNIGSITMSRVGGAVSASRTFDITVTMKKDLGEFNFSNINREEQGPLEAFFRLKGIKTHNEMADEAGGLLSAALVADMDRSSDDDAGGAMRGSADEDDESDDEDFKSGSDSDPAEEYDSNAGSSGGSDAEGEDDADADEGEVEEAPPKKKTKTKG